MSRAKPAPQGPSEQELRMRAELDRLRRDLARLKKEQPEAAAAEPAEAAQLRDQLERMNAVRERLHRMYVNQVREHHRRAEKLHQVLESIHQINSSLDLDTLLTRITETIRASLGFRIVLMRLREPGTNRLKARAFAGLDAEARARLSAEDVLVEDFLTWLREEFRISRSYFISHTSSFSKVLPPGYVPKLDDCGEGGWHPDDVLLVPLMNRAGELVAYFSLDDPEGGQLPTRETVELLEIFGNHAAVALENARLYRQLERHSHELEEAGQRMQEMHALKSQFVSTISHELRTPLTAIRAYVDTLLAAAPGEIPPEQLKRFLGIINEESHRLSRLIESVLDLNRFDSGTMRLERQPVEVAEVLEETAQLLQPLAVAGQVTLKLVKAQADTRVEADRDQMRQLVLHLGSNAVKFTPAEGVVTMRLGGDARDVTLQVEDTGIGIPEQALEKIFERFYQVDSSLVRRYGGTGLGLAICKSIVEWHGGRIFAESTPGHGSCFTVVLPRRSGPRVAVRPNDRLQPAVEDILRMAVEMTSEVMDARVVSLLTLEPSGELVVQAALGLDERVVREARIRPGSGVAGWVAEHRRPVCVSRPGEESEVAGSGREAYRSGTFLSVPLEGESGLLGVLNVTDPVSQNPFDAEDCHLLLHLADRVARAWELTLAMEQSSAHVESTARALRSLMLHLERGRRSAPDRVRLARAVARELGLAESEVGVISFAASVHDVGMTQVRRSAIERGGPLSEEERGEVEHHPERGVELLRPIETLGVVRDVILSHHEWWDGSGYPRGLHGEEIPVGARILAVVDAYESMTVGRAHRGALSREQALVELTRLKGKQFDPQVVEAFERALAAPDHSTAAPAGEAPETATPQTRR